MSFPGFTFPLSPVVEEILALGRVIFFLLTCLNTGHNGAKNATASSKFTLFFSFILTDASKCGKYVRAYDCDQVNEIYHIRAFIGNFDGYISLRLLQLSE